MIHGIVAAQTKAAIDYYAGATAVMDFGNGVYLIDGDAVDVTDLIDRTNTITGGGLVLDWNVEPYEPEIAILSPVIDSIDLSAGWTVFIEMQRFDVANIGQTFVGFWNGINFGSGRVEWDVDAPNQDYLYSFDIRQITPGDYYRSVADYRTAEEGEICKVAVTKAPDRLAISQNGSTAVADTTAASTAPVYTSYTIGGRAGDGYLSCNVIIRKLIFYPPLADDLLPAYTAL